jgi:CelD/BcsL family acetyltransferase involved in cellulose biosynthesis
MRTFVARTAAEMERIRPLWQQLERLPGATLYQSYRWNYAAARLLNRSQPFVVAVENSAGAAIIPAAVEGDSLTMLGDVLFDYRDVLSNDDDLLAEAWRVLADCRLPLRFTALRADTRYGFWPDAARQPFCGAPAISAEDISAEHFAYRHWRQAKQVRRLHREGARLIRRTGADTSLIRWIYRHKTGQLAGDPANVFADEARVEFMVAICAEEHDRCDVYGFEVGGSLISALITFHDYPPLGRRVRRYYTTTFDRRWARFSPGIALLYEVARQSLAEGLDVDLQTGEQFHKSRLATRSTPLYRVALTPQQVAVLARTLAAGARAAA